MSKDVEAAGGDSDADFSKEEEQKEVGSGEDESPSGQENLPHCTELEASELNGDAALIPKFTSTEETDPEVEADGNSSDRRKDAEPCLDPMGEAECHAEGNPGEADKPEETDAGDLTDDDGVALGEEAGQTLVEVEPDEEPEQSCTAQADANPQNEPDSDMGTDAVLADFAGRSGSPPRSVVFCHSGVRKRETKSNRRLKVPPVPRFPCDISSCCSSDGGAVAHHWISTGLIVS